MDLSQGASDNDQDLDSFAYFYFDQMFTKIKYALM